MKKRIIVILSIAIIVLLTIQFFRDHVDGVKSEREWYVKELGFQFSATVDTVIRPGNILIGNIEGDIDFNKEERTNQKLKHNGMLDLFLYRPNNKIELMIDSAEKYAEGDSLYINCNNNTLRIFRGKRLLADRPLLNSLRGRPFETRPPTRCISNVRLSVKKFQTIY